MSFREWERAVPPAAGVVPVRLPGREQRFAEPPGVDPAAIATAVAARADRQPGPPLHTLPGGHFFPQTHAREVAALVSADLIAAEPR